LTKTATKAKEVLEIVRGHIALYPVSLYRCFERFQEEREELEDNVRSGQLSTA
jgi:hypothetical protein